MWNVLLGRVEGTSEALTRAGTRVRSRADASHTETVPSSRARNPSAPRLPRRATSLGSSPQGSGSKSGGRALTSAGQAPLETAHDNQGYVASILTDSAPEARAGRSQTVGNRDSRTPDLAGSGRVGVQRLVASREGLPTGHGSMPGG
jgi:hypothetical protein